MPEWDEDYNGAALRCYRDGNTLQDAERLANACHLYGLAAECAIKAFMEATSGPKRELPHKHLPDLIDDARRWLSGRRGRGLGTLLQISDYMRGWQVENRYWPDEAFSADLCNTYRDHARRTLSATNIGVGI